MASKISTTAEIPHCSKCGAAITMQQSLDDIGLAFTEAEERSIMELSKQLEIGSAQVIRQALRTYQLQVKGEPDIAKKQRVLECADCGTELNPGDSHTCSRQVKRNRNKAI